MPAHPAVALAAALVAALVAAHAPQAAYAQGGGGMEGDGVAEELRQIRAQMEEANRRSEALFWESIAVGAAVAIAVAASSVWYLRKQANLLASDMRERLRPALTRTRCTVETMEASGGGPGTRHIVYEITNVGAVAAVGVNGRIRHGAGAGSGSMRNANVTYWAIGALAPNVSSIAIMEIDPEGNQDAAEPFWFEVEIEYMAIGGRKFRHRAVGNVRGIDVRVDEAV
ncbi:MAG: hypothetical protein OXU25_03280, partial [Thaumarchaeota archaeon]|nr:hypothetical protein [Nitrososphaerota archaeon]